MKEAIYVLKRNNIPFYVGKAKKPTTRELQHKTRFGEDITLEVIEWVLPELVSQVERFYIGLYSSMGYKLKNRVKTDLSKWKQMGDWRDTNWLLDVGFNIKHRFDKKGKDWKKAVESYFLLHQSFLELKDRMEKHLEEVRKVIPDYTIEIDLK